MQQVRIRDANPGDFDAICALNLDEVERTSPMDRDRLAALHAIASYHRVACIDGRVVAFLLAFRHGTPYANVNFGWFAQRCANYLYIDRIVVAATARGLRIGSMLYDDLFAFARSEGIAKVTCEYNLVPPNEPSQRFHDRYGFTEQGSQWIADGRKQVSMQSVEV